MNQHSTYKGPCKGSHMDVVRIIIDQGNCGNITCGDCPFSNIGSVCNRWTSSSESYDVFFKRLVTAAKAYRDDPEGFLFSVLL